MEISSSLLPGLARSASGAGKPALDRTFAEENEDASSGANPWVTFGLSPVSRPHISTVTAITEVAYLKAVHCLPMPEFQDAITQFAIGLPTEAVAMLASLIQQYSVPSQISILDELPDMVIFVISGLITSYLLLRTSNVIELSHHGPGAILGLGEVLNKERAGLRAISRQNCVLGLIPGDEFRRFLHDWPAAYLTVAKILSSELQNAYCQRSRQLKGLFSCTLPHGPVQPS